MDISTPGKKNKNDSLLHVDEFRIGARWNFWWKRDIFGQHFVAIEALSALLGLRHHWSTLLNGEIIAVSRIEAVWWPVYCYMLPFVDYVIQLMIFAGLGVSWTGNQKIPRNMRYWYGVKRRWIHGGITDSISKFHVSRGQLSLFYSVVVVFYSDALLSDYCTLHVVVIYAIKQIYVAIGRRKWVYYYRHLVVMTYYEVV